MKKVKAFAPATVANMGCGFDIMGMTLNGVGDVVSVEVSEGDELIINNVSGVELPDDIEKNVITPAVRALMAAAGMKRKIEVTVEKKILPGSGIGSSAASSAAAVYALNEALDRPFSDEKLVEFAMEGEKLISNGVPHADNVAPAILGGVVLLRSYEPLDIVRLPVPEEFCCTVAHPEIMVSTAMARQVLPKEISMHTAVTQWGNVAGLVAGLTMGDIDLVGRSMKDVVAEPHRKQFIPGFDQLKEEVLAMGALAMNISGAGPSVFALSKNMQSAANIGYAMENHFKELGHNADIYVTKVSNIGAQIIND